MKIIIGCSPTELISFPLTGSFFYSVHSLAELGHNSVLFFISIQWYFMIMIVLSFLYNSADQVNDFKHNNI